MANPTTASGMMSLYAETNINAAYLLYLQHLANTPLLIRDINNAIINQPEPLDKLNAILEEFDDYYDYESHFDGTGNGSFKRVVVNFFNNIFNHDYGTALNAIRDNLKKYNFEATFEYIDEDYSTDYLSHETVKLMWKDQHTEIIEITQMDDECSVDRLLELDLYDVGDIYSAEWFIKHYDDWCGSFTGMDKYREHKSEMIELLKTHPQPLRIYSQFEEMMSEIPGGLELVDRLDN
jgi:hypothetical protein